MDSFSSLIVEHVAPRAIASLETRLLSNSQDETNLWNKTVELK